jgi:hypothetical protein
MGSVNRQPANQYVRVVLRLGDSGCDWLAVWLSATEMGAYDLLVANSAQAPR